MLQTRSTTSLTQTSPKTLTTVAKRRWEVEVMVVNETMHHRVTYCGQLNQHERRRMIETLLGWLQSILRIGILEFLSKIGLKAALGILLAICTLSGMLIGSLLTGRYELDWSTVSVSHTIFSINPGIWEEFFFRGVIVFIVLRAVRSVQRAMAIQIVLFGLTHIKGTDLAAWADVLTVLILAAGFTYTAYKTRTLIAGIVFHFLHDAFLFLPQVPGVELFGVSEYIAFNLSLWIMVGVGCLFTKIASERLGVKAEDALYSFKKIPTD